MAARSLVVGGTGFLGDAIVEAAVAAGHEVVVLSRGLKAGGRPGVGYIAADRLGPLDMIRGERFEFVFDTCAYTPNAVNRLLDSIGGALERYVLISSASVYGDWSKPGLDENVPVPAASGADLPASRRRSNGLATAPSRCAPDCSSAPATTPTA